MTQQTHISVVLVNLNGRSLLESCLASLQNQDYPTELVEVVVVDNGSTDDSVDYIHTHHPYVNVIRSDRNLGFAGGNNVGVKSATGEYIAFLNNDAEAAPNWLSVMAAQLDSDPETGCVASKMLNTQGELIDYGGLGMTLYGRAYEQGTGLPADVVDFNTSGPILAPCGGAMLIRRELFQELGGFDEQFIAYYEDVDLGWRLWLSGSAVIFLPEALVYHRQHVTGTRFPPEQRYVLSESNALRLVIKNISDTNFHQVLSFALMMAVKRSLDKSDLDRRSFRFGAPREPDLDPSSRPYPLNRISTGILVAIDQVIDELPQLMSQRATIQQRRRRTDDEIFTLFPHVYHNYVFPWRSYTIVQDNVAEALDIPTALRPKHRAKLLIITHESVGPKMAGPGIRAWEIACALSNRHDVTLAVAGTPARTHPGLTVVGYDVDDPQLSALKPVIQNTAVIMAMGPMFSRFKALQDLDKPLIIDLYDPFVLERLTQLHSLEPEFRLAADVDNSLSLRLEGALGDFFVCASERQRDFWLGTLLSAGRVNSETYAQDPTLRQLIDIVPHGIPSKPPSASSPVLKGVHPGINADDKLLIWNGGLWAWFDPLTLVQAMHQISQQRNDVKLFFAAGRHFDTSKVREMPIYSQTRALCEELGLLDTYIFFGDWIPYDERGRYLLEADLAVSVHTHTLESHFSSRTRILDCIWAGLPVISTAGDPVTEFVVSHGLGRAVVPGDVDGLVETITDMLADQLLNEATFVNAQAVQDDLTWTSVVQPIEAFMERVAFAPDALVAARQAAEARRLSNYIQTLRQPLRPLHTLRRRVVRSAKVLLGRE